MACNGAGSKAVRLFDARHCRRETGLHPTNRNIKNLIRNTVVAWKVLRKEKPDLIISSGAAVSVPFFYLGKIFGAKLIYIEVFDRIDKPTMSGKMVYPIVDKFIVQWDEQLKVYPKAVNLGSIF